MSKIIEYTWFPLAMTSNTTPYPYVATASSSLSANPSYLAFDNIHTTESRWLSNAPICHITVDFGSAKLFNCLKYKCPSLVTTAYPNLVTIQGSNDGTNFIDISTFNGTNTTIEFMTIEFENRTNYRYYRFNIKSNFGHTSYSGLNELVYGFAKKPTNKTLILHDSKYKKFNAKIPAKENVNILPKMASDENDDMKIYTNRAMINPTYLAFNDSNGEARTRNGSGTTNIIFTMELKKIKPVVDSITLNFYYVRDMVFYGIRDNGESVELCTSDSVTYSNNSLESFNFKNTESFSKYEIHLNGGYSGEIGLKNVKLIQKYEQSIPFSWSTVSSTLPSSTQFIEQGMNKLSPLLDRTITKLEPTNMSQRNDTLSSGEVGRVFSKTIDLKKHFDIRSIRTEVK